MEKQKFNLEERLINYSVMIINLVEGLKNTKSSNHLSNQLVRSGTSPALNYGEAQAAESRKDFIHKIKIILKELRESLVCLKIINKVKLLKNEESILIAISETKELVAIFSKSVETALKNQMVKNQKEN